MLRSGVFCLLWLVAGAVAFAAAPGYELVEVHAQDLAAPLDRARDLRWDGEGSVVLAVRKLGAVSAPLRDHRLGGHTVLTPEGGTDGVVMAYHLGVSPAFLAVASSLSEMHWRSRGAPAAAGKLGTWHSGDRTGLSYFEDIDLQGSRLAIVGLMRYHDGMARDGAVAWTADLAQKPLTLRPFAYASTGRGARAFDVCATFQLGRARFLAGGDLLFVPGAEPGIQRFSPDGRLRRTWQTSPLGVDVRCDLDEEQNLRYAADDDARMRYLARFGFIDEVLDTPYGPAVLVKRPHGTGRAWSLVVLRDNGDAVEVPLPWTSPSPNARIQGDLRGDRLLLVMSIYEPGFGERAAKLLAARLVERK